MIIFPPKKSKIILFFISIILLSLLTICGIPTGANTKESKIQEKLTFFLDSKSNDKLMKIQNEFGSNNVEYIPEINLVNLKIDNENEFKKYNIEYTKLPNIDIESNLSSSSLDNIYTIFPNPLYSNFNWSYSRITEPLNGRKGNQGKDVKIAIIDSGIDLTHPGFKEQDLTQINYSDSESNEDEYGHGTQVAGVIATLSPKAKLYSYKVMNDKEGDSYKIIKAIIDASNRNVDIINISLGTEKNLNTSEYINIKAFEMAVEYAKNKGIFVVGSAGNSSKNLDEQKNEVHMPGGLKNVITVAATTKNGHKADYSNYGSKVDISGPVGWFGEEYQINKTIDAREMMITYYPITKTSPFETPGAIPKGTTLSFGTSLAAPEVSSALATLISQNKSCGNLKKFSYDTIYRKLMTSTYKYNNIKDIGVGEVRIIN
ncbi:S8 family serine peptidase [Lactococcus cremoris]|uniref:S8 family peptidase n=1 Tax=Lactococcus lactis subsp. cremoris TaxID=1359 RepID=UPI002870E04F|nr:S8 family serine peptidase [Lactococcus cremoris]MDR9867995.1 S8 family serine peptidase [Lactococcus cremoris]